MHTHPPTPRPPTRAAPPRPAAPAPAPPAPPRGVALPARPARQSRTAVADRVGSFRPAAPPEERHGLQAEYYKARRFRPADRALERLDPDVNFNFGTASPAPGKIEAH